MGSFNDKDDDFILEREVGYESEKRFLDRDNDKEKEDSKQGTEQNINFGADDVDIDKVTLKEAMEVDSESSLKNDDVEIDFDAIYNAKKDDDNKGEKPQKEEQTTLKTVEEEQEEVIEAVNKINTQEIENLKGKSIMIEGLDGSGKGVVLEGIKEYFSSLGLSVFDLKEFWKTSNSIPTIDEVANFDVVLVCEPTLAMIGKVIRDEIIRTKEGREYSAMTTAQAFSLDREILYKKLLIPAKEAGKIIVQDRGIISSLIYQPVQNEGINIKEIISLSGNRVALKNSPDLVLITRVEPLVVMERLKQRQKKDNAIFENIFFQRKIQLRYESDWLKKLFNHYNVKIEYIDTNPPSTVEDTKKKAIDKLKKL